MFLCNAFRLTLLFVVGLLFSLPQILAQNTPTLNIQGVLRNYNGTAVDNGTYKIRFALYTIATGGTEVWSETQDAVPVSGGVYSTALGRVMPMTAAFDQTYYLGVTVGTQNEMTPRALLSSAPYALSLIGQGNTFPSSGTVGVGTNTPTTGNELHVKDAAGQAKVLVEGSAGAAIEFKKGASAAKITYDGTNINIENLNLVFDAGLNLPAGQTIKYNGLSDWRLVDTDDFETDNDNWLCYANIISATTTTYERFSFSGSTFNGGYGIRPNSSNSIFNVLKKQFNLAGIPHNYIKVVFTYYFLDGWNFATDFGYAGFSTSLTAQPELGWEQSSEFSLGGAGASYYGLSDHDVAARGEMVAKYSGDNFYVFFGARLDQQGDEDYGIRNIEIWVK